MCKFLMLLIMSTWTARQSWPLQLIRILCHRLTDKYSYTGHGSSTGSYEYLVFRSTLIGAAKRHGLHPVENYGSPTLDRLFAEVGSYKYKYKCNRKCRCTYLYTVAMSVSLNWLAFWDRVLHCKLSSFIAADKIANSPMTSVYSQPLIWHMWN